MTKTVKTIKEEIAELYNEINGTSLTAEKIAFRVNGIFITVADMSDEQALKTLEGLKKQQEENSEE